MIKTKTYKIKSIGDSLEIIIPVDLSHLTDFLDYKIRSSVKNAKLAGGSNNSIEYKWLGKSEKSQIRKIVKDFFGNYIKKYQPKFKTWV